MNDVVAIMYESVKAVLKLAVRDQQIVAARTNCNLILSLKSTLY